MTGVGFGDVVKQAEAAGYGNFKAIEPGTYHVQFTGAEAVERKSFIIAELKFTVVEVLNGPIATKGQNHRMSIFLPRDDWKPPRFTAFLITVAALGVDIDKLKALAVSTDTVAGGQALINLMDLESVYSIDYEQNGSFVNERNIKRVERAATAAPSSQPTGRFKPSRSATAPVEAEPESDTDAEKDAQAEQDMAAQEEAPHQGDAAPEPDAEAFVPPRGGRRRTI